MGSRRRSPGLRQVRGPTLCGRPYLANTTSNRRNLLERLTSLGREGNLKPEPYPSPTLSRVSRPRETDSERARPNVYGLVSSVPTVPTRKNRRATISAQPRVWLSIEKECAPF